MSSKPPASSTASSPAIRRRSLTDRPLDVLYLAYFGIHLAASLAIDGQLTYPPYSQRLFPEPLRKVLQDYLVSSKDPFLLAVERGSPEHVWFRVLLMSEAVFSGAVFCSGHLGVVEW